MRCPQKLRRWRSHFEEELGHLTAKAQATAKAQVAGASEVDFAPLFAEIAERRKAVEAELKALTPRDKESAEALKPETFAEQLAAAVRAIEAVLTAPDAEYSAAEKQALLSGIIVRVTPDGKRVVTTFRTGTVFLVCTNERPPDAPLPCCAARGSRGLLAAFQAELARRGHPSGVKVSGSTCLTSCQYGPTVAVYPEGIWYSGVTEADVTELFDAHLSGKGTVARLLLPDSVRVW